MRVLDLQRQSAATFNRWSLSTDTTHAPREGVHTMISFEDRILHMVYFRFYSLRLFIYIFILLFFFSFFGSPQATTMATSGYLLHRRGQTVYGLHNHICSSKPVSVHPLKLWYTFPDQRRRQEALLDLEVIHNVKRHYANGRKPTFISSCWYAIILRVNRAQPRG